VLFWCHSIKNHCITPVKPVDFFTPVLIITSTAGMKKEVSMKKGLTAKASIDIHTPAAKVWEALIRPELIKQYLFGTEAVSDWKVGSPITYKGVWEGKSYHDKGKILQIVPEKLFQSTYWSSIGGLEDKPENYATVTYELETKNGGTLLTVSQDNIADEKGVDHMKKNWSMVLETIKKLLEK
jgi:uncharacterized protein YndB with AHSA1/START domain